MRGGQTGPKNADARMGGPVAQNTGNGQDARRGGPEAGHEADLTATGRPVVVYIQPEANSQVDHPQVLIGDVAGVYCKDKELELRIRKLPLMRIAMASGRKYAVSAMALIACIDPAVGENVLVQNIGESDFIVSPREKAQRRPAVLAKVGLVTLVTFFGSIFAIMTYNEDVDVTGVFDKLYTIVMGSARTAPGILEGAYAVGVALGIIVFFNHFGRRKLTREPTPMEIEMEKYENDITETLLKKASRAGRVADGAQDTAHGRLDDSGERGGGDL